MLAVAGQKTGTVDFVIIGLKSQGGHEESPHRVGSRFLDFLITHPGTKRIPVKFSDFELREDLLAEISCGKIGNARVLLVKPTTTMNSSGSCVTKLVEIELDPSKMIIVQDDINVKVGRVKVMHKATRAAGHNGISSVERVIGNQFARLKIGVGSPNGDPRNFFLSAHPRFNKISNTFAQLFLSLISSIVFVRDALNGKSSAAELSSRYVEYARTSEGKGHREARIEAFSGLDREMVNGSVSLLPVFVSRREVVRPFTKALRVLLRILVKIDDEYTRLISANQFYHPLVKLLEEGVPEEVLELIRAGKFDPNHIRVDTHLGICDGRLTPRIVEINSAPGGIAEGRVAQELMGSLPFFTDNALTVPSETPAQMLIKHCLGRRIMDMPTDGVVAFINKVGPHQIGKTGHPEAAGVIKDTMSTDCILGCKPHEFEFKPGEGLFHGDHRVGLLYVLTSYGVKERASDFVTDNILKAFKAGVVDIFPSPRNILYVSKGFLASLSDPKRRKVLGIADKLWKSVEPYILWARLWDVETADTAKAHLDLGLGITYYAKPFFGSGGRGVVPLRSNSHLREVDRALRGENLIIQMGCEPLGIEGTLKAFDLLWTIYTDSRGNMQDPVLSARVFARGEKASLNARGGGCAVVFQV